MNSPCFVDLWIAVHDDVEFDILIDKMSEDYMKLAQNLKRVQARKGTGFAIKKIKANNKALFCNNSR